MNAYIVKSTSPFVTRKEIKRTSPSEENRNRVEFMDSHNFSFSMGKTGILKCKVTK